MRLQLHVLFVLVTPAVAWVLQSKPLSSFASKRLYSTTEEQSSAVNINPLVQQVQPSATVAIFSKVKDLQSKGVPVTSLCVGEPDFGPPESVLNAVTDAVADGDTRYTAVTGTAGLRQAIADDLIQRKGVAYDADTQILVSNGAKQSVYQALLALAGIGDAVVVPGPYWPSYPEMVRLCHATPVTVETDPATGYILTGSQLRQTLEANPNTKALILCHPSNPTGSVYTVDQLKDLVEVLKDYPDVTVIADEIYEQLVYDETHVSVSSLLYDRTVTINGFSKAYAMTGLRLGYAAAPPVLAKAMTTIQSQLTSCAGSISQAAGVAALLKTPDTWLDDKRAEMMTKRDYVLQRLAAMQDVKLPKVPAGAFYVLPDVSAYCGNKDTEFCVDLLEKHKLALVPGSSFGAPGTIRVSYATSMEELGVAMDKLETFLGEQHS